MQLNHAQRELTVKIVYYGPGLSGKTTNLQMIHQRTLSDVRGRLLTVETHDDRTLFFDLLPVYARTAGGAQVKIKLFTVPGQVIHNSTRKLVLQGADGVAFIADSQIQEIRANQASFKDLRRNLRDNLAANSLSLDDIPLVIQFNKRDLPDIRTEAELRQLEARANLTKNIGLGEKEFLSQIFANMDTAGTELEKDYPAKKAAKT